jgi:endonuclease YncB( thermonuclease family)
MRRIAVLFLSSAIILSAQATAADRIAGAASVIYGDTIEIRGSRIRLHGIDAPECYQLCTRQGQRYRCGQEAAFALDNKIDNLG